jgi:prepilin-type N-terminal cleavage/methylation domain-containing protein
MNPQRVTPRGFTLIELLTVIAIIGILASIIIPVVGKVRLSAQTAKSVSNLRQLQLANISHAADNKGKFIKPYNENPQTQYDFSNGWPANQILATYTGAIKGGWTVGEQLPWPSRASRPPARTPSVTTTPTTTSSPTAGARSRPTKSSTPANISPSPRPVTGSSPIPTAAPGTPPPTPAPARSPTAQVTPPSSSPTAATCKNSPKPRPTTKPAGSSIRPKSKTSRHPAPGPSSPPARALNLSRRRRLAPRRAVIIVRA